MILAPTFKGRAVARGTGNEFSFALELSKYVLFSLYFLSRICSYTLKFRTIVRSFSQQIRRAIVLEYSFQVSGLLETVSTWRRDATTPSTLLLEKTKFWNGSPFAQNILAGCQIIFYDRKHSPQNVFLLIRMTQEKQRRKTGFRWNWNKEFQLRDINELHVRLRYNKSGKSLVNLPIV